MKSLIVTEPVIGSEVGWIQMHMDLGYAFDGIFLDGHFDRPTTPAQLDNLDCAMETIVGRWLI